MVLSQRIKPNDLSPDATFGRGMFRNDTHLLIPASQSGATPAGAIYEYKWNGQAWVQFNKILPEASFGNIRFNDFPGGFAVDNNIMVVGTFRYVFIYEYVGGVWVYTSKFDKNLPTNVVGVRGNTIVVGVKDR